MEWWQALILGIVQGLAEFLPISSSGHLIVAQELLDVRGSQDDIIAFDVALHAGTLLAVYAYFRSDLAALARGWVQSVRTRRIQTTEQRLVWYILLGTLPAIFVYLLLSEQIRDMEERPEVVATMLIAFSFVFIAAERFRGDRDVEDMRWWHALVIGVGQAAALVPGTSRSGATISTGMFLGFERAAAARFSFLLSVPVVTAAFVLSLPDLVEAGARSDTFIVAVAVGFVASALSGYLAVAVLLRFLAGHSLSWFAAYRIPVGAAALWYFTQVA